MKKKYIEKVKLLNYILPEEELTFLDSSPTPEISLPPKTITIAVHGNLIAYGAQGTFYVVRHDSNDTVLLNIDDYSFNLRENEETTEINGPLKTYEYHHADDLPSFLKSQAPRRVIDRVEEVRQGNLADSNFLML